MSTDELMTIGALAAATEVAVSAIRYYDEVGLITPDARIGGKRRFASPAIGRVNFVRRAQQVGFSLDEIRSVLADDEGSWGDVVDGKLVALRAQRDELDTMITLLEEIRSCGCEVVAECPRATGPC